MRVKPPGATDGGPPPISEVGEAAATDATTPAGAVDGARAVDKAAPTAAVARTEGLVGAAAIADIARRIKSGELSAGEAVELLIEEIVEGQAGTALGGNAALADELRELLRRQTESDPYLASRVRRLGNRS